MWLFSVRSCQNKNFPSPVEQNQILGGKGNLQEHTLYPLWIEMSISLMDASRQVWSAGTTGRLHLSDEIKVICDWKHKTNQEV